MTNVLDSVPSLTLGYPLSVSYRILLYFFFPSVLLLTLYLTLIAADLSLICQHFTEDNPRWATVTLLLVWWPAITSFVFTVSSPAVWPAEEPLARENLRFLGLQLWYFLGFPFAVIYRYIYRIFWSMEAYFGSLQSQDERVEGALKLIMVPSPLELYFFLQAYLHSAPQILLQFYVMLREENLKSDSASLQLLSVAANLLRMAVTTTNYQRFERRKVVGDRYPWLDQKSTVATQYTRTPQTHISKAPKELISNFVGLPLNLLSVVSTENDKNVVRQNEDSEEDEVFVASETDRIGLYTTDNFIINDSMYSELPQVHKHNNNTQEHSDTEFDNDVLLEHIIRVKNDQETPILNKVEKRRLRVSIVENPEIELRKRENRDSRVFNIVDMSKHTTPPETPAPRPVSLGVIRDKLMSNAEFIIEKIPKRTYKEAEDFDVPVRVRRLAIRGIEQEDGVSKFIAFISWLMFLTSRMITLAVFSYFYIDACFYFCIAHYLVILLFLLCNSWSEPFHRKIFYFFLSYIYVFCIIEFKTKYRKVRLWYGLYFIGVTLENFVLTAVWFWSGLWDGWWYNFTALLILLSTVLSYMCFLIYFLILKPKPLTVYPIISTQSLFPVSMD